jgi:putative lipoprotein
MIVSAACRRIAAIPVESPGMAMLPRRPLLVLPLAALPLAAARAQSGMVRGTATFRERMALPPGAVLHLRLEDVSRQDAPALLIAEAHIPIAGQVPIAFALAYDAARIDERSTYALRAEILLDGRMLFRTDHIHPVLTRGAGEPAELLLVRAREAAAPEAPGLVGRVWIAEDIAGRGVVDRSRTSLSFGADGRVSGLAGCNRYNGSYTLDGASLRFGPIAGTMMACPPALAEQEQRLHAAMAQVRGWRIANGLLHLTDEAGATVIRAARDG